MTGGLPALLAAAARVLEAAGELPPLVVGCAPGQRFLPPVTLTPGSTLSAADQHALPAEVAARLGWPLRRLSQMPGDDGRAPSGTVCGVTVEALAMPMVLNLDRHRTRAVPTDGASVTTAQHAALLRDLVDWAATLPSGVITLQIYEDLELGVLAAGLGVADEADVVALRELVLPITDAPDWSALRGLGLLPTGHGLTIRVKTSWAGRRGR